MARRYIKTGHLYMIFTTGPFRLLAEMLAIETDLGIVTTIHSANG
jgi:hypothetical protein